MNSSNKGLQKSAIVMKILGWAMVGLSLGVPIYPPGFMWGGHPAEFPAAVPHPESPYHGLHPYLFMVDKGG